MRGPGLVRRVMSTNARQLKDMKPASHQRRLRPVVPEKPSRPGPDKKKPTVVLPRVNRAAVAGAVQATGEAAAGQEVDPLAVPSTRTLQLLALQRGVPFVGFGFMDNAIMIVSGDYIEMTIGVTLGISTLTAAALGNVIADVLGLNLGGLIEELSYKLGVPEPKLSRPQMDMTITRTVAFMGSTLGIAFGCLVGMLPLAFMAMGDGSNSSNHRETTPKAVFLTLAQRMAEVLNCERAVVYQVDPGTCTIVAHYSKIPSPQPLPPFVNRQVVERVLSTKECVSLETDYLAQYQQPSSSSSSVVTNTELVQSVMCMPVLDLEGRVIALVAAVNKKEKRRGGDGEAAVAFNEEDEKALGGVCVQVAAAIINMDRRPEEQVSFMENLKLLRVQQGLPVHGIYQV